MKKDILIAPSILSADFSRLGYEIKRIEDAGADLVHIDVMDGHFVPNITIGPLIVEAIRRCTRLSLDVHLMIEEPHRFIREFVEAGSDIITIHAESYGQEIRKGRSMTVDKIDNVRVKEILDEIKSYGKKAGLSLNPDSSFCIGGVLGDIDMLLIMSVHPGFGGQGFIDGALSKIREAREAFSGDIEVDGGINEGNVKSVIEAGANIIVAGSYFFGAKDGIEAVRRLKLKG